MIKQHGTAIFATHIDRLPTIYNTRDFQAHLAVRCHGSFGQCFLQHTFVEVTREIAGPQPGAIFADVAACKIELLLHYLHGECTGPREGRARLPEQATGGMLCCHDLPNRECAVR